ncbi:hypothetical protein DACRYDRAFT_94683 [Dacryopinax primogenitus]|uniref:Spindle pole body component n=1 Tax=Dacryopinax primogenitus (strain DJM 731) TaxID=1858805 RepID=M5G296_DACPD|nr:uncharacterized protein DACRYDRAFT_94683 [Dacryopinax primogenitus]EJU02340.1 hypothetical protein DACRYDRAFT_94683 [Dacryopinax primogenitus]
MLAETFAVLAGHESSLFTVSPNGLQLSESFAPLLHPGERSALISLASIAFLYRNVRSFARSPSHRPNEYICALASAVGAELKEYEALVVKTEESVLRKDDALVGSGSFVPMSALLAIFSGWEPPLAALSSLIAEIKAGPSEGNEPNWPAGKLIDLVHRRARTGYSQVADIFNRLLASLQRILLHHLNAYLLHGIPLPADSIPSCISPETKEAIVYVGDAIAITQKEGWTQSLPRELLSEWTSMINNASIFETQTFDTLVASIRTGVSEWLWAHVLTRDDIVNAVESLADYFLLRNGEFSVAVIREVERLKADRLRSRNSIIRAQDLNHALLRASVGTSAETDPSLSKLSFTIPSGTMRPFLPHLTKSNTSMSRFSALPDFSSFLLGTPIQLTYPLEFPLSLFLSPSALQTYSRMHAYLTSVRRAHILLLDLWSSLSLAQRKRRKWLRIGEGGENEEITMRTILLRRSWGCVREMIWFLEVLWSYIGGDVVDTCYRTFREKMGLPTSRTRTVSRPQQETLPGTEILDFTTLRQLHTTYLTSLTSASLMASGPLSTIIHEILQTCERLVGQVERWGGDVLPDLLGAQMEGGGGMIERQQVVEEIYEIFTENLRDFFSLLATSPLLPTRNADMSTFVNASCVLNATMHGANGAASMQARRQVEHLMLKLDFNMQLSDPSALIERRL